MADARIEQIWSDIENIRAKRPLVHNITNYVVMEFTANALLALGASPVMAHAREEAAEMASLAGALVLNIGTLSPAWVDAMRLARSAALAKNIPVVLDPVGCGATRYRTDTARELLQHGRLAAIRGNASEIVALCGAAASVTRGVDSVLGVSAAEQSAQSLAEKSADAVVVSGAEDLIVGPKGISRVANGHEWMARVTGMGCSASALVGAFCAVNTDVQSAATHAMIVMGICGERAAAKAGGPGTFKAAFLDALFALTKEMVAQSLRVSGA